MEETFPIKNTNPQKSEHITALFPIPTDKTLSIERNLAKFASFIFTLSHTKEQVRARVKTWLAIDPITGDKVVARIIVETVGRQTLITFDHRTCLALQKLWWERPKNQNNSTTLTLKDLARTMRLTWGRKTFILLKESLRRLRKVPITWQFSFFDRTVGRIRTPEEPINILSQLRLINAHRKIKDIEKLLSDGVGERSADPESGISCFRFNQYIERNLLERHTKPIFFDTAMSLRGEIALGLYSFLDIVMADKLAWDRRLAELFRDDLHIQGKYRWPADRCRLVLRAVKELQDKPISTGVLKLAVLKTKNGKDYKLTVRKTKFQERKRIGRPNPEEQYRIDQIVAFTGDEHSRGYYSKVVRELPEQRIWFLLSESKQAHLEGRIQTTKAKYFTDLAERELGHRSA